MPWFVMLARDRPGTLENRKLHRPAHLEHMADLDTAGRVRYGGPLLNDDGDMIGSLIVLQAETLEEARATYAKDPYVVNGVFENFDVIETKPIFPRKND